MRYSIEKWCSIFNRKIRNELNRRCSKYGLHEANFAYLITISERPGISQDYLIQKLHREQSIVTKNINHLVAGGWLEKRVSSTDRRKNELFLTEKGAEILPVLRQIADEVSRESVTGLTEEEAETLGTLLKKAAETYNV
ncbi:MarR family winged helix-turn-helix transcriptional regulator [Ligilactobacillus sp.]|uniref:MarR family winged helix-turn-helix transcriptional regulator n=1 Tax=Ligilactobacillus sp. TaxID=2767921 RepID=UPI002FE2D541